MDLIPLITSIPPSVVRYDNNGREIGAAYQEACIRSWIAGGFRPISVNGPSEVVPFSDLIEVVRVARTAKELHGRPVVFIADMFAAARAATAGPVMIINADILLRPSFDLAAVVAGLRADQAIVGRRIDVADSEDRDGHIQTHGFDVFAAHSCQLVKIPDASFALGLPWWDHYVPMILYAHGVTVTLLPEGFAYHLRHDLKWHQSNFVKFGLLYAKYGAPIFLTNQKTWSHHAICKEVLIRGVNAARLKSIIPSRLLIGLEKILTGTFIGPFESHLREWD